MRLRIKTDGGARGNPGPAAIGVVISVEKGGVLKKYSQYLGENFTNNEVRELLLKFGLFIGVSCFTIGLLIGHSLS